jgi:pyruvate kinase
MTDTRWEKPGAGKIQIICTLGPASHDPMVIRRLTDRGVDLLRINLSHTALDEIESTIAFVRSHTDVPVSLDTEGAQVRCGPVLPELVLQEGAEIQLVADDVPGTAEQLTLRPRETFAGLRVGSRVAIDFHGTVLRVIETQTDRARAVVERGGAVGSNKGVVVDPPVSLPALTEKDVAALAIGCRVGIMQYALSFAASGEGVQEIRKLIPRSAHIISKIESRLGFCNMDSIIEASDAVLIDRGDLSREVALEEVPYYQKAIVRRANRWHTPLYVATNLLESMVLHNRPTIAEMNDIANTLLDGAHGLVLAAETAIGVDPVASVDMVKRAIATFEREDFGRRIQFPGLQDGQPSSVGIDLRAS